VCVEYRRRQTTKFFDSRVLSSTLALLSLDHSSYLHAKWFRLHLSARQPLEIVKRLLSSTDCAHNLGEE